MVSSQSTPTKPAEASGIVILHPEAGSAEFRRKLERPAQVGRYAFGFFGAVTVAVGVALHLFHPTSVALALIAFGAVMIALAFVQHGLLGRDRRHWPTQALLWDEGVELILENGEIRAAEWDDPKFELDAFIRPGAKGRPDEVFLGWKMDSKLPLCPITPEGLDRLREAVDAHRLQSREYRGGGGRRAMRGFEFRPFPPSAPPIADVGREVERNAL
jgi:hypothetical protein